MEDRNWIEDMNDARIDLETARLGLIVWSFDGGKMAPGVLDTINSEAETVVIRYNPDLTSDRRTVPARDVYTRIPTGIVAIVPKWLREMRSYFDRSTPAQGD